MGSYDIGFPFLGFILRNIKDGFSLFGTGFEIKFYGMVIALGFLLAYFVVNKEAKRTNQNPEDYLDYLLWLVIPAILGARIYYVAFSYEDYFIKGASFMDNLKRVINIRGGGLAIYGGIIAGVIVLFIIAKVKKNNFWLMADTCTMGLLIGQIMGRWGNFFNREAFGGFTDKFFAMAIPTSYYGNSFNAMMDSGIITQDMIKTIYETKCILVHPTFLYESLWNLLVLIFIFIYRKHKKFNGELIAIYLCGYGLGRFFIEMLRSDSLMIPGTSIKASQALAGTLFVGAVIAIIVMRILIKKKPELAYVMSEKAENDKILNVAKKVKETETEEENEEIKEMEAEEEKENEEIKEIEAEEEKENEEIKETETEGTKEEKETKETNKQKKEKTNSKKHNKK